MKIYKLFHLILSQDDKIHKFHYGIFKTHVENYFTHVTQLILSFLLGITTTQNLVTHARFPSVQTS